MLQQPKRQASGKRWEEGEKEEKILRSRAARPSSRQLKIVPRFEFQTNGLTETAKSTRMERIHFNITRRVMELVKKKKFQLWTNLILSLLSDYMD